MLRFILYNQKNPYLCNIETKKQQKMNQSFIHILLSGIIILLAKVGGSECCA